MPDRVRHDDSQVSGWQFAFVTVDLIRGRDDDCQVRDDGAARAGAG